MSMEVAKRAIDAVWKRWGSHIPDELKSYQAKDIFVFEATESSFTKAFTPTFTNTFKPALQMSVTAQECASTVAAFSTAHLTHSMRKLHISPKGIAPPERPIEVLAHEYIHWLSHESFYPSYYKTGGNHPFQVEGITEWLTMGCFTSGQVAYINEYNKTEAWLASDSGNEGRMLNFIFKGKATDLNSLHP
jgi:hypothetical protein